MQPNKIDLKFDELRQKKQKAFIAFITAGDPNLKVTEELVLSFANAGVDIMELGVPFSDPLADGPTIQAASQRALQGKVTLEKILNTVSRIRKKSSIPIALMMYYNPIFYYGEDRFIRAAKKAGVDGLIIPDLPPGEAKTLIKSAKHNNISTVFFISPTTTDARMKKIVQVSTGFIYYVSITGVTGARTSLPKSVITDVKKVKCFTNKPVCVGFGVSTPNQVKDIANYADGVIVGSAIIKEIEKNAGNKNIIKNVTHFVRNLSNPLIQ